MDAATKNKISKYRTGKTHSQEVKDKIRQSCLKREFPESVKRKIAEKNIEVNAKPVECTETGETFESISEAARKLGVAPTSISRVCHGERRTIKGYRYTFTVKVKK